jgi:hypothetical protein
MEMSGIPNDNSRRHFIADVGRLATAVALTGAVSNVGEAATVLDSTSPNTAPGDWDLSWLRTLQSATDRAVFDWPSLGDPADAIVLQIAERYLDGCRAVYGEKGYDARAVLNIRTQAIPAAMSDALWARYALGAEYNTKDPVTKEPATQNPFWHRAPSPVPGITLPTVEDLVQRGAIILVCDFAMGHLSRRLAPKVGRAADEVHADIRAGLVRGAFAVPSGIFGLARAQNSGCAYVRM